MPITFRTGLPDLPGSNGRLVGDTPDPIIDRYYPAAISLPRIGLGSGSIYVSRETLNGGQGPAPSEVRTGSSAVGKIVPMVYGYTRVLAEPFKTQPGTYYTFLYRVQHGEAESFDKLYIEGTEVDLSARTAGTAFAITNLDVAAWCNFYLGTSGQDVSTWASTYISGYSDTHAGYGIIGLRLPATSVQKEPRIEVLMKGHNQIKDYTAGTPRGSGALTYTDNAGNILIHWVESVMGRTIDVTSAGELADACAEDVGNGTERRTIGIGITRRQDVYATMEVLRAHAAAHVIDTGGTIIFVADRPATSVTDIGESVLVGDTEISGPNLRNRPDDVVLTWYDPETGTTQTARATSTISDKPSNVRMLGINNAPQAKREAVERYNHHLLDGDRVQFSMRNEGAILVPGEVIRLTDFRVGLADKPYRITSVAAPEPGLWQIEGVEYQPTVYSNVVGGDALLIGDTDLDSPLEVPDVAGLTLTAQNKVTPSGIDNQMKIEWTAPTFAFVAFFLVDVLNDNTDTLEQQLVVPADATATVAAGLVGGQDYEIKIRIQSTAGALGGFVSGFETTYHDTLVALYEFESGALATDTIGAQSLTANSPSDISEVSGKVGSGAVEIDCSTTDAGYYFQNNSAAAFNPPWTVLGWFRLTTTPVSAQYIVGQSPSGGGLATWLLTIDSSLNIDLTHHNGSSQTTTDTTKNATLNTWHFVAVQYHNGGYVVVLDSDDAVYVDDGIRRTETGVLFGLGMGLGGGAGGVIELDQVRIYRSALTGEEIESIRAAEA